MLYDAKGRPISTRSDKFVSIATRQAAAGEFIGTIDKLPNPSQILTDRGETIEVFERLAKQGDVAALIQDYQAGMAGMEWTVQSNVKDSQRAAWFQNYLDSIDLPRLIEQGVTGRDFGYTPIEAEHWKRWRGATVPAVFEQKPQKWFGWDTNNVFRFFSKAEPKGADVFAKYPNRFFLARHKHTYANPYGVGLLDLAYWFVVGLNGNFEFMMTFLEEDGRDKWVVRHPRNATSTEINDALNMAYNLRNNGVAAIPEGSEFEKKDVTGRASSSDAYRVADEMLTRKLLRLWHGTDLLTQVEGKGGYSSSQTGVELRGEALNSGKRIVANLLGQIFQSIASINNLPGSDDEIITVTLNEDDEYSKEDAERDQTYFAMHPGMKPTAAFYHKRGFGDDEFTFDETATNAAPPPSGAGAATFAEAPPVDLLKAYKLLLAKKKP